MGNQIDLLKLTDDDFNQMLTERIEWIEKATNGLMRVGISNREQVIINELRFNYNYYYLTPSLHHNDGSQFELHEEQEGKLRLSFIATIKENRGKGEGDRLMKLITKLADKYKKTITLEVDPKDGTPRELLVHLYKKYGFEFQYDDDEEAMIRPQRGEGKWKN